MFLDSRLVRAGSLPLLLLLRERAKWELPARSRLPLPSPLHRLSLPIPHRTLDDVRNRGRLRSLAPACYPPVVSNLRIEEHGRIGELGHGRVAPVDVAVVLLLFPLPIRGRERRRWSSCRSLSSRARSRRDRSRSFDRYRLQHGSSRSRRDRSRSVDRYRSRRQRTRSPARRGDRSDCSRSHALPSRSRDRSRSRGRQPGCERAEEPGRLARRETQKGAEAVASQPPAVSEAPVAVTPVAGGAALTALPSAVQDLARFFLSLSGSSSLGAVSLDLLLVVGGGTIALLRIRLKKTELMLLLPDLGRRLEVLLALLDLLGRMIVRHVLGRPDHMPGMTGTGQVLVVDPLLLRVRRMTTGLVLLSR